MAIIRSGKFEVQNFNDNTVTQYDTFKEAYDAAAKIAGNRSSTKPFPNEETYLFGPGNGETSAMVREYLTFTT